MACRRGLPPLAHATVNPRDPLAIRGKGWTGGNMLSARGQSDQQRINSGHGHWPERRRSPEAARLTREGCAYMAQAQGAGAAHPVNRVYFFRGYCGVQGLGQGGVPLIARHPQRFFGGAYMAYGFSVMVTARPHADRGLPTHIYKHPPRLRQFLKRTPRKSMFATVSRGTYSPLAKNKEV